MPRIVDHAQRREEIVLGLWQVIHERGIDGVSFRTVAEAAGVSIGRVQHYFGSKDELVVHGCRAMVDAAQADHGPKPLSSGGGAAARDVLIAFLEAPLPESTGSRLGASVWVTYQAKSVSHPGIAQVVAEALAGRTRTVEDLLVAARGPGAAAGAESRAEALALASLSEGLTLRVLVGALPVGEARALIRDAVDRALTEG